MVELISWTQDMSGRSLEEYIAYVARVSNPGNQVNAENSVRLIDYLIDHEHWSPFEMASICLSVTTTRDIARQMLRHRSFSFQEVSQRYAATTLLTPMAEPVREARMQDRANRQNSLPVASEELAAEWLAQQRQARQAAAKAYVWALEQGIAKEVARAVLPEGLTTSRLYMSGTVRSWIHYIALRTKPETQKEHREIAVECAKAIAKVFPKIEEFVA